MAGALVPWYVVSVNFLLVPLEKGVGFMIGRVESYSIVKGQFVTDEGEKEMPVERLLC